MTKTPNEIIDSYFEAKGEVHKIFGYESNWVEIPLDDERGSYWLLTNGEGFHSRCVWSPEPFTEEGIRGGKTIYSASVYTQRFLEKWVYRAKEHVLICVDTQTDGNKFLKIFNANQECSDDNLRQLYKECWGEE